LSGTGTLSAVVAPVYNISASLSGAGMASATAENPFTPFNDGPNTNVSGASVPAGCTGVWVTMIGGGRAGTSGGSGSSGTRNGGNGGGGGARVGRSFIPVANLGSTYSVTRGGASQS